MSFLQDQSDLIPIAIGVAAIVTLLGVILGFAFRRGPSKSTILLLGINDAGKTALFTTLCYGQKSNTATSMKENEGTWTVDKKSFEIVDIPGHERVRIRYTDFLPVTRAIVFVVDSTTVARQVRAVAEYLYNVLAQKRVQSERIPILIACNKADMITALPKEKIKLRLEAEIQQLRSTRTAAVEQQEAMDDEQGEAFLGFEGEDFTFEQLDNEVSFESCSVEKADLGAIEDYILSN